MLDRALITVMKNYMMEKLDGSNQSFSSLRGTFSNREEGNTPMQLKSERQSKLLERWFALRGRSIYLDILVGLKY